MELEEIFLKSLEVKEDLCLGQARRLNEARVQGVGGQGIATSHGASCVLGFCKRGLAKTWWRW